MKKILHITTDNKFISQAMHTFENVYPKQNTVWMLDRLAEVNTSGNKYQRFSAKQLLNPLFIRKLKDFDLIVLHAMSFYWYPLIIFAPGKTKFSWIGWGYDYYEYIYNNSDDLLLPGTLGVQAACKNRHKSIYWVSIKRVIRVILKVIFEHVVIKKIDSISPVLEEDYKLIRKANLMKVMPDYVAWNYGSLEEDLVQNFIGQRVSGNAVLVGNSASLTNNHLDSFALLKGLNHFDSIGSKMIVPLSYGSSDYQGIVLTKGRELFGDKFTALTDFMPIDEYVSLIKQCGYVVMNHKRQQAVGNIVIMLYLGARVFLRKENPTYIMLKKENVIINTVEELERQPDLLRQPLREEEIQNNIRALYRQWSRKAIDQKTQKLVEYLLGKQLES